VAAKPAHSKPVQKNPTSKTATAKPIDALGRDESKHISCKYDGHEDDCPDDCAKCAISIKTDGDIALASNRPDEAIRQYKKAVFVSPKFAEAWVNLGNAYGMKSEYNNALSAFNKAIAIDPIYGKALFGKAITLRNLKMFDEAMEIANTILSLYDDANVLDLCQYFGHKKLIFFSLHNIDTERKIIKLQEPPLQPAVEFYNPVHCVSFCGYTKTQYIQRELFQPLQM
jgi:tetratricopeptide (TPR) repeat protein